MTQQKTIKNVLKLRKELYARSLADKIARDTAQFNLKEAYKPLLEGQKQQTESQKEISEAQQNLQDARSQELTQKHEELISEIRKQPLIIPLIKALDKEPKVVDVIKGKSDGSDLTEREQHILQQLNKVDDRVLKTLTDFYSSVLAASELEGESGIETKTPMTEESQEMFDRIMQLRNNPNKEETKQAIKKLLNEDANRDSLLNYLKLINYQFDLTRYPYTTIKRVNPALYKEIQDLKTGKGFVKFLSSDPQELFNKLNILIAEKEAGNNNVLNEASAITDELRRLGFLTINQIKKLYTFLV